MVFATAASVLSLGVVGCASSTSSTTAPSAPSISAATSPSSSSTTPAAPNPVATVDGTGERLVRLPRNVVLPAIVHASYTGGGNFLVNSRTADGSDTGVLANSLGVYEGTFPVGFVDPKNAPTAALHVEADGPWRLDIASASLAPKLTSGFRGNGDAVLAYRGPEAPFHVTHSGNTSFVLRTYGGANLTFARASGGADAIVTLAAGPLFIAVTTAGDWTIAPA